MKESTSDASRKNIILQSKHAYWCNKKFCESCKDVMKMFHNFRSVGGVFPFR